MLGGSTWLCMTRATNLSWLRANPNLAPLGRPNWIWPSMNQYRMFFIQTFTLHYLPSMHWKLTKRGKCCVKNNQLPTKTCVQSEDNSIVLLTSIRLILGISPTRISTNDQYEQGIKVTDRQDGIAWPSDDMPAWLHHRQRLFQFLLTPFTPTSISSKLNPRRVMNCWQP